MYRQYAFNAYSSIFADTSELNMIRYKKLYEGIIRLELNKPLFKVVTVHIHVKIIMITIRE